MAWMVFPDRSFRAYHCEHCLTPVAVGSESVPNRAKELVQRKVAGRSNSSPSINWTDRFVFLSILRVDGHSIRETRE